MYQQNKGILCGTQHYYAYHTKVLQNKYFADQCNISSGTNLSKLQITEHHQVKLLQQLFKSAGNLRILEISQRLPQRNRHLIITTKLRSSKDTISYLKNLKCTYKSLESTCKIAPKNMTLDFEQGLIALCNNIMLISIFLIDFGLGGAKQINKIT